MQFHVGPSCKHDLLTITDILFTIHVIFCTPNSARMCGLQVLTSVDWAPFQSRYYNIYDLSDRDMSRYTKYGAVLYGVYYQGCQRLA